MPEFKVVRDLSGALGPIPIELPYLSNYDASTAAGTSARYKGSLVALHEYDDIDHGVMATFATTGTECENLIGILAEDVAASTTYTLDIASATGDWVRKKIFPILPSSIIRGEYARADSAGTATTDTAYSGSAGSTTLTAPTQGGTADANIGAWIYFLTGSNANYLHYIRDSSATTSMTLRTALVNAVTSSDTCLFINPPFTRLMDFNATLTGITSECVYTSRTVNVVGLDYWLQAPGVPLQKLDPSLHDGQKIADARFYHDFIFASDQDTATGMWNVWLGGIKIA